MNLPEKTELTQAEKIAKLEEQFAPPKAALFVFLADCPMEGVFELRVASAKIKNENAIEFVHKMRVELSRLRELSRQRGRFTNHFKMLHIDNEYDATAEEFVIRLKKTVSRTDVSDAVAKALGLLEGGDLLNG